MASPIVAVVSALKASYRFGLSFFSANKKNTKTRSGKMDTGFTDNEEEERYGSSYGPWSIDVHPTKPWALLTLGTHYVEIWDYRSKCLHMYFELPAGHIRSMYLDQLVLHTHLPNQGDARCGKFIARKDWVVAGFTGGFIAVYNYSTKKEVAIFSAHRLVVTSVAVHPFLPYVLSSSGNELIKLWDWENGWACIRIFEGHSTSVTHIAFNPKDPNTFASASHDTTIKVWNLGSSSPDFTLDGHEDIVNCVDYYTGDNRPYLISGSYDGTAKVWDYETKTCIQTLKRNNNFFTAACFHPQLPIIITGSSDGEVCYWDSITYRLDNVQDYGSKVGCIFYTKGFERFATILASRFNVIKLRHDRPVASIHPESGTILLAKHNKILKSHISTDKAHYKVTDGERLSLATEELCPIDMYPQFSPAERTNAASLLC